MPLLQPNDTIGTYRVQSLIKSNLYTETYRVEDRDEHPFFLKLFILKKMPRELIDSQTSMVREIQFASQINHKNLLDFIEHGSFEKEVGQCQYYITSYLTGSILSDKIARQRLLKEAEALPIFRSILEGLQYLHTLSPSLCHNDLDPSNIMIPDLPQAEAEIIDYGHLSERCGGYVCFDTSDLDVRFHADETMVGIFDEQGDIYSACAILYNMIAGNHPYSDYELHPDEDYKTAMKRMRELRRNRRLDFDSLPASDKTKHILRRGLESKNINRFASVSEILELLDSKETLSTPKPQETANSRAERTQRSDRPFDVQYDIHKGNGNGFKDIAGMQPLKDELAQKVIFFIKNKDLAAEYKVTPPNGMLLYGPPGCGKTFFAEKFAEETGFNYLLIRASDVASSWQDGPQQMIGQLFKQAAENAPIVICFDEFDSVAPDRSAFIHSHASTVVNELLSQINNCAQRGIFVVATTNRPDKIDPAIMRTGRLDKLVYVPMPDLDARREMFALYLKDRPQDTDVDVAALANLTDGYIASDIAYIVNDAAMVAAYSRQKISHQLLENSIHNTHPSLRHDSLREYDEIRRKMENRGREIASHRIGFDSEIYR